MDIEVAQEALRIAESQLKNAINTIADREESIGRLQAEIAVLTQKVLNTEKDRDQMRTIMTNNITDSNKRINDYAAQVAELKAQVHILKQTG